MGRAHARRAGLIFLQLLLAGGLMSVWVRTFNWALLDQRLRVHHVLWLTAVPALAIMATMLRAWRLQLLVAPHVRVGWFRAFCIT